MAANDHTDFRWDDRVISELASLAIRPRALCAVATAIVPRFAGYDRRFDDALARARKAGIDWCDGSSCPDDLCTASLVPVTTGRR